VNEGALEWSLVRLKVARGSDMLITPPLPYQKKHGRRHQSAAGATAGGPIARKERVWSAGCPFAEATGGPGVVLISVYPVHILKCISEM
jgi:hypothetical protein